jgi:DNA-binding NtrC family response regulator
MLTRGFGQDAPSAPHRFAPALDNTNIAHLGLNSTWLEGDPSLAEALPPLRVLLVDSDAGVRRAAAAIVQEMGLEPVHAATLEEAQRTLRSRKADLLLLDVGLPGAAAAELLQNVRERWPEIAVVVMTAHASVSSVVDAIRLGACDYLTKPFDSDELADVLRRAGRRVQFDAESRGVRERLRTENGMGSMIGRSPEMDKVYRIVSKVALSNHPVLITGESGTGKEMVARSIHANGPNAASPFVVIDCAALAADVIENELFGIEGASGDATCSKAGLLSAGDGGTVFLEEVGDLPLDLQGRLLQALKEKEVRRIGGTAAVPMSARILASTNRDLGEMVAQGRFRRDLFFRLNVVNIKLPPLRERREDIRVLAEFFLARNEEQAGVPYSLSVDAIRTLSQYGWPGNVRELEHAIERACALSSGPLLHMADLPTQLQDFRMHAYTQSSEVGGEPRDGRILSIADRERHAIVETIRQFRGDKLMAARVLGIGKTTLYRKLKEYGIAASEISGG